MGFAGRGLISRAETREAGGVGGGIAWWWVVGGYLRSYGMALSVLDNNVFSDV